MLVLCKKCKIEHDEKDVNHDKVCLWCEFKTDIEDIYQPDISCYSESGVEDE